MKLKPVDRLDQMFRAFSDRTRLRILALLRDRTLCVNDFTEIIGISQPKASRHLAYLRGAGLVATERQGKWVMYRLAPAKSSFHRQLLACLDSCFHEIPDLARDEKQAIAVVSKRRALPETNGPIERAGRKKANIAGRAPASL